MSQIRHRLCLALLAAFTIVAQPVNAATFTVNSLADAADTNPGDGSCDSGGGACTLRAAIEEANALADNDNVEFSVTGTITLGSGLPNITQALTITGPGTDQLTVSGNNMVRPFYIASADVSLSGITIRDGFVDSGAPPFGGGIFVNSGALVLEAVVVRSNTAHSGGGIYTQGTLTINNSTIRNNSVSTSGGDAFAWGGGIYALSTTVTISNSTISGNTNSIDGAFNGAAAGGGIAGANSTLLITNSTISGNLAKAINSTNRNTAMGGGIYTNIGGKTLTIHNSTISSNSIFASGTQAFETGGGIYCCEGGALNLANSILAANRDTRGVSNCHVGDVSSYTSHHNIEDANTCGLIGTGDIVNTAPLLEMLGDYGGPTQVHYLSNVSPAIDSADDGTCPATDQRGLSRPQDGDLDNVARCDMGAVEYSTSDTFTPHIQVLPQALDFGTISGNGRVDKKIYVLNDGKTPLMLGPVGETDPLEAPFSISDDACSNKVLLPGAFCVLTIRFDAATIPAAMLLAGLSFSGLFVIGMLSTSRRYKKQRLALYLFTIMLGTLLTACGSGDSGTPNTDFTGSFDIPSNDPDTTSITVNVKGSIQQ